MAASKNQPQASSFLNFLLEKIRKGTLIHSAARWLRARGFPVPLSWEAYRFVEYQRARWRRMPAHSLAGVGVSAQKGLVSIVLPVYNEERFVEQALDSIFGQTYENWELIVVDDGSTDRSGEILDQAAGKDQRIRVIHQPNRKLPTALNEGFRLARGEYLTWTSCDNSLHPDYLEKMVAALEQRPACDMVYANIDIIGSDGLPLRRSIEYLTYQQPYGSEHIQLPVRPDELNVIPNNFIGPAFLYRRRTALLVGDYRPERFTVEDYDYWMRINALLRVDHTPFLDPVYDYRFHAEALSARRSELGITQLTKNLIAWDGFRLDFYLTTPIWYIEDCSGAAENEFVKQLKGLVVAGGGLLAQDEQLVRALPERGLCLLRICITADAGVASQPPDWEDHWLNVLVLLNPPEKPIDLPRGFHLGVIVIDPKAQGATPELQGAWLMVSTAEQLAAAADIRARTHALQHMEQELFYPQNPMVKASVVVCSYKRAELLRKCLASLSTQSFSGKDFEIIVINNAVWGSPSYQEIQSVIQATGVEYFDRDPSRFRWVHCPVPGLSISRNVGLAEARGEIVCFIDDDAIAEKEWLQRLWEAFQKHPEAGVVGGTILLVEPQKKPRWYRPSWGRFWGHLDPGEGGFRFADQWQQFPWGGNWAARRQALRSIGGFRTRFGRHGNKPDGGEEIIANCLIQQLGYRIGFEPGAIVHHLVEYDRFSIRNFWHSALASRRSWYQLQREGYIAWELSFWEAVKRILQSIKKMREESVVRVLFTTGAELVAQGWLAADSVRRTWRSVWRRW